MKLRDNPIAFMAHLLTIDYAALSDTTSKRLILTYTDTSGVK